MNGPETENAFQVALRAVKHQCSYHLKCGDRKNSD